MEEERITFQRGELMKQVLAACAGGLILGVAITMPGILLALRPFLLSKKVSKQSLWKTYKTLVRRKLVKVKEKGETLILEVTEDGKKLQKEYQLQDSVKKLKISIPKTWDGKWRLVAFDIPEPKKHAREALRDFLKQFGFCRAQKSVFVHPFHCESEIDLLTETFDVQKHVQYFTLESQKMPTHIARHFSRLLAPYMK